MSKIKKHCQNFMICIVLHNLSFACFFVFAKDMNKNFFAHVMKMMKAVLAQETFFSDKSPSDLFVLKNQKQIRPIFNYHL